MTSVPLRVCLDYDTSASSILTARDHISGSGPQQASTHSVESSRDITIITTMTDDRHAGSGITSGGISSSSSSSSTSSRTSTRSNSATCAAMNGVTSHRAATSPPALTDDGSNGKNSSTRTVRRDARDNISWKSATDRDNGTDSDGRDSLQWSASLSVGSVGGTAGSSGRCCERDGVKASLNGSSNAAAGLTIGGETGADAASTGLPLSSHPQGGPAAALATTASGQLRRVRVVGNGRKRRSSASIPAIVTRRTVKQQLTNAGDLEQPAAVTSRLQANGSNPSGGRAEPIGGTSETRQAMAPPSLAHALKMRWKASLGVWGANGVSTCPMNPVEEWGLPGCGKESRARDVKCDHCQRFLRVDWQVG